MNIRKVEKVFFVVTSKEVKEKHESLGIGRFSALSAPETSVENRMEFCNDEKVVINKLVQIASNESDPREVESIFSVNEFGTVVFFEAKYVKGKFQLMVINNPMMAEVEDDIEGAEF